MDRAGHEPESPPRWRRILARLGLTPKTAAFVALGYLVGLAGALSFVHLSLPLPWFLGALTACLAASVAGLPLERPRALAVPTRCVLGVTVGASFAPELLGQVGGMVGSLAVVVPFTAAITIGGLAFFERVARFDRPTAFFCAVPGGLTDMITMAGDAGANTRVVTLIQATRIVMLVFLVPFWVQWIGGHQVGGLAPRGVRFAEFLVVDAVALVAIGWAGWRIAQAIGLAGAPLVGPMLLSGAAHAMGLTSARMPIEILIFAQVTLGLMLGAQFRGLTWTEFRQTMIWGAAFSVVLILATAVVALVLSRLTGFDATTLLLAYAPGGQTELNLLAYLLHLDAAFTALHHLVRLAIVILGAQIVFAMNRTWRPPDG